MKAFGSLALLFLGFSLGAMEQGWKSAELPRDQEAIDALYGSFSTEPWDIFLPLYTQLQITQSLTNDALRDTSLLRK
jgi:hypothetical protein